MKRLSNKGITLIEIVLGIAIIGIILVTMIPLFSSAFVNIKQSGDRTEAIYSNQSIIEANNAGVPTNQTLTVNFNGLSLNVNISVFETDTEYSKDGKRSSVFYFEAD